jgi:hypothetical protein
MKVARRKMACLLYMRCQNLDVIFQGVMLLPLLPVLLPLLEGLVLRHLGDM